MPDPMEVPADEIHWYERPDGIVEVRDSRTGYLIPVRYGLGVWPDEKIVGAPPPSPPSSSASSGKCPKYKEMHTFSKMGMSEISRNVYLSEIKAPAGAT